MPDAAMNGHMGFRTCADTRGSEAGFAEKTMRTCGSGPFAESEEGHGSESRSVVL